MVLPLLAIAATAISAGNSIMGGVNARKNAKRQARIEEMQADDAILQAEIQDDNADRIKISASRIAKNAIETLRQTALSQTAYRGEMRTAYAKAGVTNTGSASLTIDEQLMQDEMKLFYTADNARFETEQALFESQQMSKQANITRRQADQMRLQATYTKKAGKDAFISSLFNAGGSVLSSLGGGTGGGGGLGGQVVAPTAPR